MLGRFVRFLEWHHLMSQGGPYGPPQVSVRPWLTVTLLFGFLWVIQGLPLPWYCAISYLSCPPRRRVGWPLWTSTGSNLKGHIIYKYIGIYDFYGTSAQCCQCFVLCLCWDIIIHVLALAISIDTTVSFSTDTTRVWIISNSRVQRALHQSIPRNHHSRATQRRATCNLGASHSRLSSSLTPLSDARRFQ